MGDIRFILGFVAGWIATTEEGRKTANDLANNTAKFVKENLLKPKTEEKEVKEDKAN